MDLFKISIQSSIQPVVITCGGKRITSMYSPKSIKYHPSLAVVHNTVMFYFISPSCLPITYHSRKPVLRNSTYIDNTDKGLVGRLPAGSSSCLEYA
jgi:hypothetical protein